jgi:cobalamin synthase
MLPDSQGKICFTVTDFPSSGFVTSIKPACEASPFHGSAMSVLTVEATPAAAPQNFNASVIASGGNWTSQVPLGVTVIPAMPAWIPWSIILVFALIVIIPVVIRRKRTKQPRRD